MSVLSLLRKKIRLKKVVISPMLTLLSNKGLRLKSKFPITSRRHTISMASNYSIEGKKYDCSMTS